MSLCLASITSFHPWDWDNSGGPLPGCHLHAFFKGQNGPMCGRYVMSKASGDLVSAFDAKEIEGNPPPPSWNVAPTQDVPIIAERLDDGAIDRRLLITRWGLVPSWAKDLKNGSRLINARSESILEKPSFRKAAVKRRALIPAEGYSMYAV